MWYAGKIKENVRTDSELCSQTFSFFFFFFPHLPVFKVHSISPATYLLLSHQKADLHNWWCDPVDPVKSDVTLNLGDDQRLLRAHQRQYASLRVLGTVKIQKKEVLGRVSLALWVTSWWDLGLMWDQTHGGNPRPIFYSYHKGSEVALYKYCLLIFDGDALLTWILYICFSDLLC